MENKLDKLFRDKLENHSVRPSASAWERVKVGTPKKNNTPVWAWRIAAAVALMGVTGWFAYTQFDNQESLPVAQNNVESETKEKAKQLEPIAKDSEQTPEITSTVVPSITPTIKKTNPIQQPVIQQVAAEESESLQPMVQLSETVAVVETAVEPTLISEPVEEVKKEKPMVIVYTLASVEPKQRVEPAKVKPFRKVIEFAQDVKGGDVTLASVRDWKDNLFGVEEQTVVEKQNN
jgi:hypothetical protein